MSNISIDQLAGAVADELSKYSDEIADKTKKAVEQAAKDCNEEIKKHITFKQNTGEYVKAFRLKTAYEDKFNKRKIWHVGGGQYRLTHLLEFGHAKVKGGRTRAFPHVKYGEEIAQTNLVKYIKEAVEG